MIVLEAGFVKSATAPEARSCRPAGGSMHAAKRARKLSTMRRKQSSLLPKPLLRKKPSLTHCMSVIRAKIGKMSSAKLTSPASNCPEATNIERTAS